VSIRSEIVTRIIDQVPELKSVRGTVNIEAILRQGFPSPACFVYRLSTNRDDSLKTNYVSDFEVSYTSVFRVIFILKIDRDDGSVDEAAERLSRSVANALESETWVTSNGYPLVHQGGSADADLKRNLLFWEDYYETQEILSREG
jgi:hypothetical protein